MSFLQLSRGVWRRLNTSSSRWMSHDLKGGAVGDKGGKATPNPLNYPSAEPYLHLREGKRNMICINKEEVEAAKKNVPYHFRTWYTKDGVKVSPKYGGRARMALRKRVLKSGREWPWKVPRKKMVAVLQFKGRKRWREAETRFEKIKENMAKMPEKIAEYRRTRREKTSLRVVSRRQSDSLLDSIREKLAGLKKARAGK